MVRAAIESMTGARFVHDTLERCGWEVEVADAVKVKGLAPLACKTDRIDAWVLAELSRRDLVPAIWLPGLRGAPGARAGALAAASGQAPQPAQAPRACAADALRARVPGQPTCSARAAASCSSAWTFPDPWRCDVLAAVALIDDLDRQIAGIERELQGARRRSPLRVSLLQTVPGIAWVLGYTIAAEIGDIERFATPTKLAGYTGLCPRVHQSGAHGPPRPAGQERARSTCAGRCWKPPPTPSSTPSTGTATSAPRPASGRQRGAKVAQIDIARRLTEAIWHMLTRNQPFAPAGATLPLAA